jgi:hypothetical protein
MLWRRLGQGLLRAVNPISRSQRNDGFGAHSGPSRGDPCRRALRPTATYAVAICYVCFTSIRDSKSVATAFRFGSIPAVSMAVVRETIKRRRLIKDVPYIYYNLPNRYV